MRLFSCSAVVRRWVVVLWVAMVAAPSGVLAQRSKGRPAYDHWTTYLNPEFRYQVPVPPGLRALGDPRKGRNCRFASDDGVLELRVWGVDLPRTAGDPLNDAWREAMTLPDRRVDFQDRGETSFVVAGRTVEGRSFVEKVILGRGVAAGFNISYPVALARRFSEVVDEVEHSFGWGPTDREVVPMGPPSPGIFKGVRDYFTGEGDDQTPPPSRKPTPEPTKVKRDPTKTTVDLTPPPPKENPTVEPMEKPGTTPQPETQPTPPSAPASSKAKRDDLPYGIIIVGKKGYVYSPYTDNKQQVDVTGIPTGTKVKCPYTSKVFRVP